MYIKKGNILTISKVKAFLNTKAKLSQTNLEFYAEQFVWINDLLLSGKKNSVCGMLEKAPKTLDGGYHYYSIIYVSPDFEITRVWMPGIARFIGAYCLENNREKRGIPLFGFKSNAIGMSRLLDATEKFFRVLEDMGGCYAQISLL